MAEQICAGCGHIVTSRPQCCVVSGCGAVMHVQKSMHCATIHYKSCKGKIDRAVVVVMPLPRQQEINDDGYPYDGYRPDDGSPAYAGIGVPPHARG